MNFDWNDKTIRWYRNANQFTGFYKNVANVVAPHLSGYETMRDLGCGLGLVDLELSGAMSHIDCIDKSLPALASLHQSITARGIKNVRPILQDVDDLSDRWDVTLMSFFGSRVPDKFLSFSDKVILVVCGKCHDDFIPSEYRRFRKNSSENTELYLKENNIAYDLSYYNFEFGQPFENITDAFEFVSLHSPGITKSEISDFLEQRLVRLHSAEYEYYIPRNKQIGIFTLQSQA
jgi:hypothetical protein